MNVNVKCFAQLARDEVCDYKKSTAQNLPQGSSVKELIGKLGFRDEEIKLIYVNHLLVPAETLLHEGDNIALAPATGGM